MNNLSARFFSFVFFFATTASPTNAAADAAAKKATAATTTVTNAKTAAKAPAAAAPKAPTTRAPVEGELAELARSAISSGNVKLPKGASVTNARATTEAQLPLAPSRVSIEMTPLSTKRAGKMTVNAVLVFWKDADIAARFPVSLELNIPAESLSADVVKGSSVTLVVQRGGVEVSAPAVTSADGDVGDVIQVLLKPSGRAMRGQIVARDRVVATEDGR